VTPTQLTKNEIDQRAKQDFALAFSLQPEISKELTLEEAIARALKFNFDNRLKQMELALAASSLDVAKWQMLPSLSVSAGYMSRDNDQGSSSLSLLTRRQSLEPSTSEDRHRSQYGAVIAWNVLDFGVSYVRAKQSANQVLIANERHRKVIQNIINDVRYAYWRAAGAEALADDLQKLTDRVSDALARSRQIEEGRLMPPLQALAYQRALMDTMQLLMSRRNELLNAKLELSALINIKPGTQFKVAAAKDLPKLPALPANVEKLEQDALRNRPELLEEDYRFRISELEVQKSLLSLLPGLDLSYGHRYDSNSYLYNHAWRAGTINVSTNLLRAFQAPDMMRNAEDLKAVENTRRLAMSVAVVTQVRLAVLRYNESMTDLRLAQSSTDIDSKVQRVVESNYKSSAEGELEVIRAEARSILSKVLKYVAYASAQSAYGRILHSAGYEELPKDSAILELPVLAKKVREQLDTYYQGVHPSQSDDYGKPKINLTVLIGPVENSVNEANFSQALQDRLALLGVNVVDLITKNTHKLSGRLEIEKSIGHLRRAKVTWELLGPRGNLLKTFELKTSLADSTNTGAWKAIASAAADQVALGLIKSNIANIEKK